MKMVSLGGHVRDGRDGGRHRVQEEIETNDPLWVHLKVTAAWRGIFYIVIPFYLPVITFIRSTI